MARIFFFTWLSGFHLHARTSRNLASKETPTIMEFPRAYNEERLQAFERPAVRATAAGILAALSLAPHNSSGEFQRIPEDAPCLPRNFPTPRSQRCSPRPKGGAW